MKKSAVLFGAAAALAVCLLSLAPTVSAQDGGAKKDPPPAAGDDKQTTGTVNLEGQTITTPSGLKYTEVKIGTGAEATVAKRVYVHYTGTLENGKKFDSSLDRGQPFDFILGQGMVIAGWEEGIKGMKVGGKRKLVIPSKLGYGDKGAAGVIPPKATLIFDVELMDVK